MPRPRQARRATFVNAGKPRRERTRLGTQLKPQRKLPGGITRKWTRYDLLTNQGRWWVDRHGVWHDVTKIDRDYQEALLHYFRVNASRLQLGWLFNRPIYPYRDDFEEMEYADPQEWIMAQPLVKALVEALGA